MKQGICPAVYSGDSNEKKVRIRVALGQIKKTKRLFFKK